MTPEREAAERPKMLVDFQALCSLASKARIAGTQDAFIDVALQWAGEATKHIAARASSDDALIRQMVEALEGYEGRYCELFDHAGLGNPETDSVAVQDGRAAIAAGRARLGGES